MKLNARRGRNQKGICFISADNSPGTYSLTFNGNMVYADIRSTEKVPPETIVIDSRVFDLLQIDEGCDITLEPILEEIPICHEIRLGVASTRGLDNQKIVHAMSKRIDDFQEFIDDLILHVDQEIPVSKLGINLHILSLSPADSTGNVARISWNQLLKIRLVSTDSRPYNLCILIETAAATQIVDVLSGDEKVSRHQAILSSLQRIEDHFTGFGKNVLFSGMAFSDSVFQHKTFDTETGEEIEITSIHSPSLIGAFRNWIETVSGNNSNLPSNPGEALKQGLATAQSLSEKNNLQTALLLFSSGIYSSGQNPVKITRTQRVHSDVIVFALSVGSESEIDIMKAIAKEGNGVFIHIDSIEKLDEIVDTIDRRLLSEG